MARKTEGLRGSGEIMWSVYLERSNSHGPLPPMRMICHNEEEARKEFSKPGAVSMGREVILEERK